MELQLWISDGLLLRLFIFSISSFLIRKIPYLLRVCVYVCVGGWVFSGFRRVIHISSSFSNTNVRPVVKVIKVRKCWGMFRHDFSSMPSRDLAVIMLFCIKVKWDNLISRGGRVMSSSCSLISCIERTQRRRKRWWDFFFWFNNRWTQFVSHPNDSGT